MTTPIKSVGLKYDPRLIKRAPGNVKLQPAQIKSPSAMTQEQIFRARQRENSFIYRPAGTGWSVVAPGPLSTIGKEFQRIILARDWDALFRFLPIKYWGRYDTLGKYSFTDINGKRTYIPFSREDIGSFIFSPYYSVQKGYACSDNQRQLGVDANVHGMNRHGKKFRNTDARHIWPIFPGWGYGGSQRYGCEKQKKSTWVKIRKGVVGAAAVVAAVYLGPIALAKIKAIAGGTGVGSAVTGGKVAAGAQKLVGVVNKGRTIKAITKGKLPPPPIDLSGKGFRDWAFLVAKDEYMQKVQRKMTSNEENKMRAEIAQIQSEINTITPPAQRHLPPQPVQALAPQVQIIQRREEQQAGTDNELLKTALIVGIPAMLLMMGS